MSRNIIKEFQCQYNFFSLVLVRLIRTKIFLLDHNIYSEPPGNKDVQHPLDDEIGITNPRNEKALEKMGELHTVTYSGSKRVL